MGYANNALSGLPFGAMIGGPLKAAIEAQALAARTTVDFIKAVGFEPPVKGSQVVDTLSVEPGATPQSELGPVRNVTFSYTTTKSDGTKQDATLKVPILTIVPIPYIRIDEMTIDFTAKILEQEEHDTEDTVTSGAKSSSEYNGKWSSDCWWWKASASFNYKSSFSTKHTQSASSSSKYQSEYTMNVHVRAVQDDMPAGLSRILTILSDSIKETRKDAALPAPK